MPASSAAPFTKGDALIFGGHLASYSSEFYNPSTNIWARTGNIGVNPPNGPLTLLGTGKVLLAGGESGYGTDALCRLYDSSSNARLLTGSMNQARTNHSATRLLTTDKTHADPAAPAPTIPTFISDLLLHCFCCGRTQHG